MKGTWWLGAAALGCPKTRKILKQSSINTPWVTQRLCESQSFCLQRIPHMPSTNYSPPSSEQQTWCYRSKETKKIHSVDCRTPPEAISPYEEMSKKGSKKMKWFLKIAEIISFKRQKSYFIWTTLICLLLSSRTKEVGWQGSGWGKSRAAQVTVE